MRAIINSDVLIDYLQGVETAKTEINRYSHREISIISWMEILAGADSPEEEEACREFLETFVVHPLSIEIAEHAVVLRKKISRSPTGRHRLGNCPHGQQPLGHAEYKGFPQK